MPTVYDMVEVRDIFGVQQPVFSGKREVRFALFDHLGSTKMLINDQGDVVWPMMYASGVNELLPFGQEMEVIENSTEPTYNLNFTNKELDRKLELNYFGARYYHPELPRFISPDPVGGKSEIPMSWNKYLYCRNDPVNMFDPDGEWAHIVIGAVVGAAGGAIVAGSAGENPWKGALAGGIGGAVTAATMGLGMLAVGGSSAGCLTTLGVAATSGGVGGLAGGLVDEGWEGLDNSPDTNFEWKEVGQSTLTGVVVGLPGAIPGAGTTAKEAFAGGLIDANVGLWSYVIPNLTELATPDEASIGTVMGLQPLENAYGEPMDEAE